MCTLLHYSDIYQSGVRALTVLNWIYESISEFFNGTKQILLNKVNHAVIWNKKIKLQLLKS